MISRLRRLSRRGQLAAAGCLVVLAALAVAGITAAASGHPAAAALPRAGNFRLQALNQPGTVSLAAYQGRPVIINFFASWCAPCQRETPLLARYYASQHGRVAIIGVDANDKSAAALKFLRSKGVRYPVAFDPFPASTATSYGVAALPQTFFLNARHEIVRHLFGPVTLRQLTTGTAAMNARPGAAALGAGRNGS
jgi:cytochrome c biogenesis protein CcmG, thiol:disulfide interchange protein DsbE